MVQTKIIGTGSAFPEGKLRSSALCRDLNKPEDWITQRTGIEERRVSHPKSPELTSDLAAAAARKALSAAGLSVDDMDLILCCTATPDKNIPNTACVVQRKLSATRPVAALDLNAACAGYIYGLNIVDGLLRAGLHKRVLLIGCEVLTSFVDWADPGTCILFGDGAGAMVLEAAPEGDASRIYSHHIYADGNCSDLINLGEQEKILMRGREVFRLAVTHITDSVLQALHANGYTAQNLDWFVPHQANLRIIETVAKNLEFPMEKVISNIALYGNTSAASIPTAFDEAVRQGTIKRGQLVCFAALGAGITYGSTLLRY